MRVVEIAVTTHKSQVHKTVSDESAPNRRIHIKDER